MAQQLPGWVVDDDASIRAEVAEWRDSTPAERWRLARACARDVMWALRAGGHAERVLAHTDSVPASTKVALARLRKASGWCDGGR